MRFCVKRLMKFDGVSEFMLKKNTFGISDR